MTQGVWLASVVEYFGESACNPYSILPPIHGEIYPLSGMFAWLEYIPGIFWLRLSPNPHRPSVLLSTLEARYISAVYATKTAVWLWTLPCKLHLINNLDPIDFHINSQSAITLVNLNNL